MSKTPLLYGVLIAFLLSQAGLCHAETTYSRSWSSSVTTRSSSRYEVRRSSPPHIARTTSGAPSTCSLRGTGAQGVVKKVGQGKNDNNCVLFLRQQRGIDLPKINLTTFAAKVSIINAHVPRPHSVAIIRTPGANARIGHLAEVVGLKKQKGQVHLLLYEANNPRRGYFKRTITGRNLREVEKRANIVGYFNS